MADSRIDQARQAIRSLRSTYTYNSAERLYELLLGLKNDNVTIPQDVVGDALNVCRTHAACSDNRSVESYNVTCNIIYLLEHL